MTNLTSYSCTKTSAHTQFLSTPLSPVLLCTTVFCTSPPCPSLAISFCLRVELIVHENLEVMYVGEALARADRGRHTQQQQQHEQVLLPPHIFDEQISESQEERNMTTRLLFYMSYHSSSKHV